MNSFFKLSLIALLIFLFQSNPMSAQKGGKHKHSGKNHKTVVIKNPKQKHYKYKKVYHPVWAPTVTYYRRWVYFPHYNLYWDNYSGVYVYWGGNVWVRTPNPPPVIINVNLSKEKKYELKEQEDVIDDIYGKNNDHKKEYPWDQ